MTKFLKILLLSLLILQLLVASSFELAHDESYYWMFSKNLDWGYFDHPPFVAVIIRMFSFLPHSELTVRLGFIVLQFLALALTLKIVDPRYHLRATLMYFAFPLASLSGLLALPDMPLLFMTALYLFSLKLFLEKRDTNTAMMLSLVIALLLYAKYHGILLVFFTVMALPGLFKEKKFYLVALTALVLFMPHLWWQYQHDFATLRYHFLERPKSEFNIDRMFEFIAVQIILPGVLAGPLVWWIVLKRQINNEFERALKFICIGSVFFFLISTLSKKYEANWTIFLALPLIYLSVTSDVWKNKIPKALLYASFALVVGSRLIVLFPVDTFGIKRLNEVNGWEKWAQVVNGQCQGPIVANTYQIASKLSFYLDHEIRSINYRSRKNQFDIWGWDLKNPIKDVCYITQSKKFPGLRIWTPEEKELMLVKNQNFAELMARKESSMR
ncbi:MAG TPA: glycosyltransferase family 39 protein [Bacteriovoracaceae bacterium]|nr:glycosyltransferase family 39 protein [Bacteriovoracaceae bacterium]